MLVNRLRVALLVGATAVSATGCSVVNAYEDPLLVGDWKLKDNASSKMSIDLDGDGKSTIAVTLTLPGGTMEAGTISYKLDWEQSKEDEFEIKFACTTTTFPTVNCDGQDFKMECSPNEEGDELDCKALDGIWTDPNFDWVDD